MKTAGGAETEGNRKLALLLQKVWKNPLRHDKLVAIRQKENTHGRIGCICAGAREAERIYKL
jgi:hypothetical protein